jgi:hypothetical protein
MITTRRTVDCEFINIPFGFGWQRIVVVIVLRDS